MQTESSGPDATNGSHRVFVVDDDPAVRRALSRLFRAAGWETETFSSGSEFLERMPGSGTGCVVLDIRMPGMSGPQLRDRMAEKGIALPIVFLTGHGDVPTGIEAMKKGAVDFLLKPVDDATLLGAVSEAISRHAASVARERRCGEIAGRYARLSAREREVMGHVLGGRLNKQIASDMKISVRTVKTHRSRVMEKMGVRSVAQLVRDSEFAGITSIAPAGAGDGTKVPLDIDRSGHKVS